MNRRLIRPHLNEIKENLKGQETPVPHHGRPSSAGHSGHASSRGPYASQTQSQPKKMYPPTDTGAENYYYLKQMEKKTPMAVVFQDGEILEGYVEWYDRNCIKLNRNGAPNLLVYKNAIKYLYKLGEGKESPEEDGEPERK